MMSDLTLDVKHLIIDTLNLEDVSPDAIINDEPLFVEGLGLDSIDALELGIAIKNRYDITMNSDDEANIQHFASINNLVKFIEDNRS